MSYPVGGPERNLLIEPQASKYRLTSDGHDVRTADPTVNPEQFIFWEESLASNLLVATGSFVPRQHLASTSIGSSNFERSNLPVGVKNETTRYYFYFKSGGRYYFKPQIKGRFFGAPTYGDDLVLSAERAYYINSRGNYIRAIYGPLQPSRMRFFNNPVISNPGSARFSRVAGLYNINGGDWINQPLNWLQVTMLPQKTTPGTDTGQRFKVRSTADGGGFMVAEKGKNVTSTDVDDYIVHPDKKTFQVFASFTVTLNANQEHTVVLPTGSGRPLPLIFQKQGGGAYYDPFVHNGYNPAAASFTYENGNFVLRNDGDVNGVEFKVVLFNVEIAS